MSGSIGLAIMSQAFGNFAQLFGDLGTVRQNRQEAMIRLADSENMTPTQQNAPATTGEIAAPNYFSSTDWLSDVHAGQNGWHTAGKIMTLAKGVVDGVGGAVGMAKK